MDSVDAGRHRNMHCSQFSGRHVSFLGKLNFFIARNSYGFYFMYVSSPAGRRLTTSSLWWRKSRSESLERWQKLWRFKDLCSVEASLMSGLTALYKSWERKESEIMQSVREWTDPLEMFLLCSIQYLHWWIVWSKPSYLMFTAIHLHREQKAESTSALFERLPLALFRWFSLFKVFW